MHTRFTDADGHEAESNPLAHAGNRWAFNPSCVFTGKEATLEALGRVLAHEFGHMLRITRSQYAHADDRGVAEPWRNDIWSRMRLMAKYVNFGILNPDRSWQDSTYGPYDFDRGACKRNGHNGSENAPRAD